MLLSIIIVTFNAKKYLKECLRSIFSQKEQGFEVIVVDNGSSDTTEALIHDFPRSLIYLRNDTNRGACFARNQGIKTAHGDFVLFLDCDVMLSENFISQLKRIFQQLPDDIGGISPKIVQKGSQKVFSCGIHITPLYRVKDIGAQLESERLNHSFSIDGPNASCAIYRKNVLLEVKEKTGIFDASFFFMFEEADLALRIKKKGYSFVCQPDLVCYHKGNSSATDPELRRYYCVRNRLKMIKKNTVGAQRVRIFAQSFFYELMRTTHFLLTNKFAGRFLADLLSIDGKKEKNPYF